MNAASILSGLGTVVMIACATARCPADAWKPVPSRILYQYAGSQKTPFHAKWGRCLVTVDGGGSPGKSMRAVIAGPGRGERREIDAAYIGGVKIVHLDDSTAGELEIDTEPMSNRLGGSRQYVFSQDGGLRNIISSALLFEVVRTPKGGTLLTARSPAVLELADDICHACDPAVAVVFRWNGRRASDVTRRYPSYAQAAADAYRREILKDDFFSRDYRRGAVMGCYANSEEIGRGGEARRWLKRNLPKSDDEWLEDTIPEIRQRLAKIPAMVWTSRQTVIHAPQL